jgi:hypothetical protein
VFTTVSGHMGATWSFRQSLYKFGYLGTARLNDADSIVFWYLPKGAEKYRVVFAPGIANQTPGPLHEDRTRIEEYVGRSMRHLVAAQCSALYSATFDAGGRAMDDPDWDEAGNGAFFRNFLSGMS